MEMLKSVIAAVLLSVVAVSAGATAADPKVGQEYRVIPLQNVDAGNKVEVTEFFWYNCPHCNAFEPYLASWVKSQAAYIVFKRVPVAFRPVDENQQKLYYALELLGKTEELHTQIFHAIHVDRVRLTEPKEIFDFVASHGVDRETFINAFNSFAVQAKVQRATQLARQYQIDGVPLVAIEGKYETSPTLAGASLGDRPETEYFSAALQVMNWLVAKTAAEKK